MKNAFFDPGALNHRFNLQRIVETPDGCGGTEITWKTLGSIWGKLTPSRALQRDDALQAQEEVQHNITVRFRADIASNMRLQLYDRSFDVITVHDPDERQRYLVCRTREVGR